MKLSEAIREGAKLSGQAFGYMTRGGNACALGAASEWDMFCNGFRYMRITELFPILLSVVEKPCKCEYVGADNWGVQYHGDQFGPIITHLNDHHLWSREAIAEWVEVVENKLEAARVDGNNAAPVGAVEAPASVDSPASVLSTL